MERMSDRMVDDMKLAGLGERTRESYLGAMRMLVGHYGGRPPGQLTPEQLRAYFLHLIKEGKAASTVRVQLAAGVNLRVIQHIRGCADCGGGGRGRREGRQNARRTETEKGELPAVRIQTAGHPRLDQAAKM